jgi:hypothetical protein
MNQNKMTFQTEAKAQQEGYEVLFQILQGM